MGADRDNLDSLDSRAHALLTHWSEQLSQAKSGAGAPHVLATHEHEVSAEVLAGIRGDTDGFDFLRSLLDAVMSAGDPFAAAIGLRDAAAQLPESLPLRDRLAVRAGGFASLGLPWVVMPLARRWLRDRVSGLVFSQRFSVRESHTASSDGLAQVLSHHAKLGCATVFALTGDAVLGAHGVDTEVQRLQWLAQQPGVRHVAVDPQRLITGLTPWGDDADANSAALALRPLLDTARSTGVSVTLHPTSYHGAVLAPEILVRAYADPTLNSVTPGIWLPAELPESGEIADRLIRWSRARVREGGAPLAITVGHTSIAGYEHISSLLTGLAVPTLPDRPAIDAQLLRLLNLLLGAAAKEDVQVVCATEDPQLLAVAIATAHTMLPEHHTGFAVQLRAGTANELAHTIAAAGEGSAHRPHVLLELPVTADTEHAGMLNSLVTLAAEACESGTPLVLAAQFMEASSRDAALENDRDTDAEHAVEHAIETEIESVTERAELHRAIDAAHADILFPSSHRTQRREREWDPTERDSALFYRAPAETGTFDTGGLTAAVLGLTRGATGKIVREPVVRALPVPAVSRTGFANEPVTDALAPENREWMRRQLRAAYELRQSWQLDSADETTQNADSVSATVTELITSGIPWRELRPTDRSVRVRRLALGVAAARDRFFTVCAAESGAPVPVIDAEINGAIDAARALASQATGLGTIRGAVFQPDELVLVVCEAGIPLDERAEAILAALAAGSAVLCVVHPTVARSTQLLSEEWAAAGLPEGLLRVVVAQETPAGVLQASEFAIDPRVNRALVLGQRDTARQLQRARPGLRVDGRFRVLGSVGIAPSADLGHAVRETVRSAFGAHHAAANTAHALVLLGNTARSATLLAQLEDAVRAVRVGDSASCHLGSGTSGDALGLELGPLPAPPSAAGLRALTELNAGERWLVRPEALDSEWRIWSPGVRTGVKPNSPFWADAIGMPVIGVATARTVPELITLQSLLGGGSVAALFATEPSEVLPWIDGMFAARLSVGHATSPAQVERHPGGGWGAAGMGAHLLAGGPHRLKGLGSWELREGTQSPTLHLRGLSPEVKLLIETTQPELDYHTFDQVRRAALSDALVWRTELGTHADTVGLGVRQHFIRRRPVRTHIRHSENASLGDLVRVLAAALVVNTPISVSTGVVLPHALTELLTGLNVSVSLERDDDWVERMAVHGPDGFATAHTPADRSPAAAVKASGGLRRIPVSRAMLPDTDHTTRIRLIGGNALRTTEWIMELSNVSLWAAPVTMAGSVELHAFLSEQAISIAADKNGMIVPIRGVNEWIEELDWRVAPA